MNYLIQLFWCILTNSISQRVHQEIALLKTQHFMGTLCIFYFCPGKHVISPAVKFFRYNYSCSTMWSISWVALLPVCTGMEANSKQFSEQNPDSLVRLHPNRDSMHIFPIRYLSFFPKTGNLTPNLQLGQYTLSKIIQSFSGMCCGA